VEEKEEKNKREEEWIMKRQWREVRI